MCTHALTRQDFTCWTISLAPEKSSLKTGTYVLVKVSQNILSFSSSSQTTCHINSQVRSRVTLEDIELQCQNTRGQGWFLDSWIRATVTSVLDHHCFRTQVSHQMLNVCHGTFSANGYTPFLLFGDPRHFEGLWNYQVPVCFWGAPRPQHKHASLKCWGAGLAPVLLSVLCGDSYLPTLL